MKLGTSSLLVAVTVGMAGCSTTVFGSDMDTDTDGTSSSGIASAGTADSSSTSSTESTADGSGESTGGADTTGAGSTEGDTSSAESTETGSESTGGEPSGCPGPSCEAELVASAAGDFATAMVVDDEHVYFAAQADADLFYETGLFRVPIAGGSVETRVAILPGQYSATLMSFSALDQDADAVYYAAGHPEFLTYRLARVGKEGGVPQTLHSLSQEVVIGADADHLYFLENATLRRVPIAGGEIEDLFVPEGNTTIGFAVTDGVVYWGSEDGAYARVVGQPASELLVEGNFSWSRAWVEGDSLFLVGDSGAHEVPLQGGAPRQLAPGLLQETPIAITSDAVVVSSAGALQWIDRGDGRLDVLPLPDCEVRDLASDASHVYVLTDQCFSEDYDIAVWRYAL